MKKLKLLSLLLIVAMVVGLFAGCGAKVSMKDIEADPAKYVEEGLKKSFAASPFGEILELENPKATAVDVKLDAGDEGYMNINFSIANSDLALLAKLEGDMDGEEIDGKLFLDKENIALQSSLLEEIFETDALGISLKDFKQNFQESAWYDIVAMIVEEEGIDLDELLEGDQIDTVTKALEDYIKNVEQLAKDCTDYTVEETTTETNGKDIKCFKVTTKLSENADEKLAESMKDLMKALATASGEDLSEEEMDELLEETMDAMKEEMSNMTGNFATTYYIAEKGGAVVKIETGMNISEDEDMKLSVDFGAEPEKLFAPSFNLEVNDYGDLIILEGRTTVDKSAKAMQITIDCKQQYEGEDIEKVGTITIDIDNDGKYTFNAIPEDEEDDSIKFNGEFSVKDAVMHFTVDLSELEDAEIEGSLTIDINFNANVPTAFEYENILDWDEDKIMEIFSMLGGM